MFYLIQFFKIISKTPIRGFFLFIFSLIFVFSVSQKTFLEEQFIKLIPENKAGSYFYALIASSESTQTIAGQMRILPGVHKVEILTEAQIKEEVKAALGTVQADLVQTNLDLNYSGLKIILIKDLKPRAIDLIRDYLVHLGTEGNITLGAVKVNDQSVDKRNQLMNTVKTWGYLIYLVLIFIFWFLSLMLVRAKIIETSYLLESYQRRRRVGVKIAGNGLILFFMIATGCSFLLGLPQLINLGIVFIFFVMGIFLHLKKYKWEGQ